MTDGGRGSENPEFQMTSFVNAPYYHKKSTQRTNRIVTINLALLLENCLPTFIIQIEGFHYICEVIVIRLMDDCLKKWKHSRSSFDEKLCSTMNCSCTYSRSKQVNVIVLGSKFMSLLRNAVRFRRYGNVMFFDLESRASHL